MSISPRIGFAVALTLVALACMAGPASAVTWAPVESGLSTGERITAIAYQGADRFWYVTSNGKIRYRQGGVVKTPTTPAGGQVAGVVFNDVAFKPASNIGIAVGTNGNIWRTTNGGALWARVSLSDYPLGKACGEGQYVEDFGPLAKVTNPQLALHSVTWGPGQRVFVTGQDDSFLRSSDDGASFTEINRSVITEYHGTYPYDKVVCVTGDTALDVAPLAADPNTPNDELPLYFLDSLGLVHFTPDGLTTAPTNGADLGYPVTTRQQLVVSANDPTHQWVTSAGTDQWLWLTEDGNTAKPATYENLQGDTVGEYGGIDGAGTPLKLVAAAKGGDILISTNGSTFYMQRAAAPLATNDWYAVSGYDAQHFAVGGQDGKLVVTANADAIPDITAPTGSISGPDSVSVGQPATFTVNATDAGSGIDEHGYQWKLDGATQAGTNTNSITFTAIAPGHHTVQVTFRDRAGNTADATHYVWVLGDDPTPPSGSIAGPATATVGQAVSYTASVSDAGSGIDETGFAWWSDDQYAGSARTVTLTFTTPGWHYVDLEFADMAGNYGWAGLSVIVTAPTSPVIPVIPAAPAKPAAPAPTPAAPLSPPAAPAPSIIAPGGKAPVAGGAARVKGRYLTVRVKGKIGVPPGRTAAQTCKGKVGLSLVKGKQALVYREAKLTKKCVYDKTIRIPANKVGKAKKLTLVVKYIGTAQVAAVERKFTIKVVRR